MPDPFIIEDSDEEQYITVHVHPKKSLLFLGTSKGCIEIWDMKKRVKTAELRYLELDDFGEGIPVDDPVVHIASNSDCSLVYGFMGNAAYCIEVELRVIIQQIPISEQVVHGTVERKTGEIAVITSVGYLSEWSPKFYERVYSFEFQFKLFQSYLCYQNDGSLIMVMKDKINVFGAEGKKRYLAEIPLDMVELDVEPYLKPVVFDQNKDFKVFMQPGHITVYDKSERFSLHTNHPFRNGKDAADELLRKAIKDIPLDKVILEDFRLQRRGKDRYLGEVDAIRSKNTIDTSTSTKPIAQLIKDDSKTLTFAFKDYDEGTVREKSMAKDVIQTMSVRHQVHQRYLFFSWQLHHGRVNLIDYARQAQEIDQRRKKILPRYMIGSSIISLVLLILSIFIINDASMLFQIGMLAIDLLILFLWRRVNQNPFIPWLEEYKLFRLFNFIILFVIIYRLLALYSPLSTFLPS
ncbi:MAG: hypothetical protein INQ03_04155 [Candidatus Heimdallarchaeota archaeon]|nr:hypothetical protein [Candidatus Heimdallarchaeota archaeon]